MTVYSKYNIVYHLQKWMDSVPGQTFLNYAYSWGASIVILGTLFKLTHLPGANLMMFVGMGGWISGKLVLDLISGPEVVRLTSVTMRESSGIYGLISRHYYLCGRDDEWTEYQMEISSDEYYELEGEEQVTVLCYPRTERILKFL